MGMFLGTTYLDANETQLTDEGSWFCIRLHHSFIFALFTFFSLFVQDHKLDFDE